MTLIFFCGLEDAATVNVTEQLVTGSIEKLVVRQFALPSDVVVSAPSARSGKVLTSA
jgi:hypothetical protein